METLTFLMTTSFYPPYHIGGDAIHVKYLAEELAKMGHEVHILYSLDAYKAKIRDNPRKYNSHNLYGIFRHVIRSPMNFSAFTSYVIGKSSHISKKFEKLLREIKPDVVHHHNISLLGIDLIKKRNNNYLNLYTAHDYWFICQQNNLLRYGKIICENPSLASCIMCSIALRKPPQFWRFTNILIDALKTIDVIIAPSMFMKNKLIKHFRNISTKTVVIPNFAPEQPIISQRQNYNDYYLYSGVLEPHKGIMELLIAFKEASSKKNLKLLIAGRGSLKNNIQRFIKKSNLNNIHFLGYLDHNQLIPLLRNAKALIIPSKCPENCPLIALEALSLGTPIIVSNNGGLPEIAKKVDNKLIFNSLNELITILTHFDRNKHLASKIKNLYKHYYSPEAFLNKYLDVIKNSSVKLYNNGENKGDIFENSSNRN